MSREAASPGRRAGSVLLAALWFGLVTGIGEVLLFGAQRYLLHLFIFIGRGIIWMAPLGDALFFVALAVPFAALAAVWPKRTAWALAIGFLTFLGALSLLFMYTPLHQVAAALLALGLGVQAGRMAATRERPFARFFLWSTPVIILLVATAASGVAVWSSGRERRAVATLPPASRGVPNVLLVILDTVRDMNLSLYGYQRPTTPFLQRFARQGVRFDHAVTPASWTLPAHASIFTGHWPTELSANWLSPLDDHFPTVAEALRSRGYRTAGFVANLLYCDREKGLNRGFDHYEDFTNSVGEVAHSVSLIRELSGRAWIRKIVGGDPDYLDRKPASVVNAEFLGWLDHTGSNRPFFAFLNYFDAHAPYVPSADDAPRFRTPGLHRPWSEWIRYRGRPHTDSLPADFVQDNVDRYDASLAGIDRQLDSLFAALARRGLLEHTVVIVTSDHGELLGEHDLMGHGNSLYAPLLTVPLVIRFPGSVPAGDSVTAPVSLRDLPATIMDLAADDGPAFPGRSLARWWHPESEAPADTALSILDYNPRLPKDAPISRGSMGSIFGDSLHYIRQADGREQLYAYPADWMERHDLSGQDSAATARMRETLRAIAPSRFRVRR